MRTPPLLPFLLLTAAPLSAQQLSGEGTCARPDTVHQIRVGDRPDHVLSIAKNSCSWTKPFRIGGQRALGGTAVQTNERNGNRERFSGHFLDTMSGGDTVHYEFEGTATYRGEQPGSVSWSWTIVNGTGKLKGVSGRGTCKGAWPGGTYKWACTGGYRMGG